VAGNGSSTEREELTTEQLTVKQEQLIPILASGIHINAAAAQVGISERTAYRWMKLERFQQALHQARQKVFNEALEQLRDGVEDAIKVLKNVMMDAETPAATRVRACQIWIEQAVALYKDDELEAKFAAIEQIVKDSGLLEDW
jgi:hypothetical protein